MNNEYPERQVIATEVDEQAEAPPGHLVHAPLIKLYPELQVNGWETDVQVAA